ncbi:MAG: DUF2268 domain-containing putative Zn-dependent protease [Candidatus Nanohalobium sp.]
MEFEKYKLEKHRDDVKSWYAEKVNTPSDIEPYRDAVEKAIDDIQDVLGLDVEFTIVIGETDVDEVKRGVDGELPQSAYVFGMSFNPGMHDVGDKVVYLSANTRCDYWRPGLKHTAVHEASHQKFFAENPSMNHRIWESMIFEGHAISSAEKVSEERDYQWSIRPDRYEGTASRLKEELDMKRAFDHTDTEGKSQLFLYEGEEWPGAKGYVIAFEVYQEILDRKSMEIGEPIEMSHEDMRKQVEKSVENLYGED